MQQDWVLDVLADLRTFARQNAYSALAEQLDDTILVAAADIHRVASCRAGKKNGHERQAGSAHHWAGGGENP
ncbi:hypothetical protein DKT77_17490 [Meridianimarinicoccus roseus]|jgi:hypothetical protein|uniref:Uncharacterized protein n=1 Tax=Meridianimarinicoccus roseus TaxID=2072018 RepID=A0A2V2LDI4_9RHOB|nr:hypothetical protein DKT77_17490 [Meridianimarinicoccus roseus]